MSNHPFYGLLYIILLPFALLMGLSVLTALPIALSVPMFLIPIFMMACFVIYIIATFIFYIKAIQQEKACKPVLRDWIRVNAFVIVVPTILFVLNCTVILFRPALINDISEQFKNMQQQSISLSPKIITAMAYAMLLFAAAMLVHIIYTFRLLRLYKHFFGYEGKGEEQ